MSDWYYMFEGQQQGPVTASQLKALAAAGSLGREDFVWSASMPDWVAAKRVRGLHFPAQTEMAAAPVAAAAGSAGAPVQSYAGPAPVSFYQEASSQPSYAPAPAYQTPDAPVAVQPLNYSGSGYEVSPTTIDLLRKTRPWVLLISILMFIGTGLVGISALISLGGMIIASKAIANASTTSGFGSRVGPGAPAAGAMFGMGMMAITIFLLVYAALLFFPGFFLMRYAIGIGRLTVSRRTADLEYALKAQKSYWMFVGILILIGISFWALSFIMMVVSH